MIASKRHFPPTLLSEKDFARTKYMTRIAAGSQQSAIPRWEQSLVICVLVLSTSAILPLLRSPNSLNLENTSDSLMQLVWAAVYLVFGLLFMLRFPGPISVLLSQKMICVLGVLPLLSTIWSSTPNVTFQRGGALLATTFIGIYFGARYSQSEFMRLLGWAFAICMIVSIAIVLLAPDLGLVSSGGGEASWRGAFTTRGQLGRIMALATMYWIHKALDSGNHRACSVAFAGLSGGLVFLSNSQTSLVVMLILIGLLPFVFLVRRFFPIVVLLVAAYICGSLLLLIKGVAITESVVDGLGRDMTFTGRTELWDAVWAAVLEKPWLGYGYSGYWGGWDSPARSIWLTLNWQPPHAHNGYLELGLNLGFIGLGLFFAFILVLLNRSLLLANDRRGLIGEFPLAFVVFTMLSNVTEVSLMSRNSIYWILTVALAVQLQQFVHDDPTRSRRQTQRFQARQVIANPPTRAARPYGYRAQVAHNIERRVNVYR